MRRASCESCASGRSATTQTPTEPRHKSTYRTQLTHRPRVGLLPVRVVSVQRYQVMPGGVFVTVVAERLVRQQPEIAQIDPSLRPAARGKFLFVGDEKFHVRGVTYGTFRPQADGAEFPPPEVVERDFALMAAH